MIAIKGNDIIVEIQVDGTYLPVFCGIDCTFNHTTEMIEVSTVTSGVWKEFRPRSMQWSMDCAGLSKIDNTDGQIAYAYLIDPSVMMTALNVRMTFTDFDGNIFQITGQAYIPNSSISGPVDRFNQSAVTFQGTGPFSTDQESSGSACTPVTVGSFSLPDAVIGSSYSFGVTLSGTAPFDILGSSKPDWLTPAIDGNTLTYTNNRDLTSDDAGTAITVNVTVENCAGDETRAINKTINVTGHGPVDAVNNSDFDIVFQNGDGTEYTVNAGDTITIAMPDANISIISGSPLEQVDMGFYTSLPSGIVGSIVPVSNGNTYATSNLALTNYIQFTTD